VKLEEMRNQPQKTVLRGYSFLDRPGKKGGQTTETRVPQPRLGFSQHASIRPFHSCVIFPSWKVLESKVENPAKLTAVNIPG
jgi:hypothetical protein